MRMKKLNPTDHPVGTVVLTKADTISRLISTYEVVSWLPGNAAKSNIVELRNPKTGITHIADVLPYVIEIVSQATEQTATVSSVEDPINFNAESMQQTIDRLNDLNKDLQADLVELEKRFSNYKRRAEKRHRRLLKAYLKIWKDDVY